MKFGWRLELERVSDTCMVARKIAACQEAEKSCAFPMFHALARCDTSSAFVSHGKKSAWVAWNSLPQLTDALLSLACAPTEIPERSTQAIEKLSYSCMTKQALALM